MASANLLLLCCGDVESNPGPVTVFDIVTHKEFIVSERKNLGRVKAMFSHIYCTITKKKEATAQVLLKAAIFCQKAKTDKSKRGWDKFVELFRNVVIDNDVYVDPENNLPAAEGLLVPGGGGGQAVPPHAQVLGQYTTPHTTPHTTQPLTIPRTSPQTIPHNTPRTTQQPPPFQKLWNL